MKSVVFISNKNRPNDISDERETSYISTDGIIVTSSFPRRGRDELSVTIRPRRLGLDVLTP